MDEYLRMRKKKGDKRSDNKDIDIDAIEKKVDVKQEEEELRAWRRKIRIKRNKEDAKWRKYREDRAKFQKEWKEMTKDEKKEFKEEKERKEKEWSMKKDERKKSMDKRNEDDEKWRNKRKEIKERMNIPITSLVAILVIIDNCTRKCLGLPVFVNGKNVTADDVIKALRCVLHPGLTYIISDNGQQFIAKAFQELCASKGITHVRITPHRPATNGIAERFVRRLKEMLACREWDNAEELMRLLEEEVVAEYNDAPHQGLDGLSPDEYKRRLMCMTSG
jgi:transposase InsO family protein